jgi:predicted RNase H-like HicB family nuclease
MLYPVYIHLGDENHAHGVTIPDFPGCFSAADDWVMLPAAIQEAVEVYFEGEKIEPAKPTPLEVLAVNPEYQGGAWLLVDVDLSRLKNTVESSDVRMTALQR